MKVTALTENRSSGDLCGEHGLSVYIEYQGKKYLLDTGSTGLFLENARKLGIEIAEVDTAFLSHVHYDHSGGFGVFFEVNKKASVYLQTDAGRGRYYKITDSGEKYIGIPEGLLEAHRERFVFVDGNLNCGKGIHLLAHHTPGISARAEQAHMYHKVAGTIKVDNLKHEQSLVFETKNGLVVLNSCCHAGVDVVIEEAQRAFPGERIAAVIGGFHLMGSDGADTMAETREDITSLAERLRQLGDFMIYTGHCTGMPAFDILKQELGNRIVYFSTGTQVIF